MKNLEVENVVYENLETSEENILNVLREMSSENILGANVTIPFKEIAAEFFNNSNPVNTIYKNGNDIQTTSTDFKGFRKTLEDVCLEEYDIFVFGSGGVSKSISFGFGSEGISPIIVSRPGKINYNNFSNFKTKKAILINATPLGTLGKFQNESPTTKFSKDDIIYDLVYNPEVTKFIRDGNEKSCLTFNGLNMLIYQAIFSMELFLNKQIKVDEMFENIKKEILK